MLSEAGLDLRLELLHTQALFSLPLCAPLLPCAGGRALTWTLNHSGPSISGLAVPLLAWDSALNGPHPAFLVLGPFAFSCSFVHYTRVFSKNPILYC